MGRYSPNPETFGAIFGYRLFAIGSLGIPNLHHWSHEDAVAADKILKASRHTLTSFFIIRQVVYFSIWSYVGINSPKHLLT